MLIEKIQRAEDFTSADNAVAGYILDPANQAYTLTSTQLGRNSCTSQSAVIRFCAKLGYSSYRQFMLDLAEEFKERTLRTNINLEKPFTEKLDASKAKKSVTDIYKHILSDTDSVIDEHILQRVYLRLKKAGQIDIYGSGISAVFAKQLAFDLTGYGYPARFMDGENAQYFSGMKDSSDKVAIIYSFTGNNPSLNRIAVHAREKGIYTVAFTGKFNTPLSQICSDSLYFVSEYFDLLDNIAAEIGAMYLNHILLSLFLSEKET